MKKALKLTGRILLWLLALSAVFLIVMAVYNQIMLKKNRELYETPLGQLVEVDGHNMSIYTEGEGEHTIVIMAGSGMVSPILDYSPLYRRLSDTYKIAVIEKFGYGFSDVVDGERDFDTILRQDREALEKAGVEAPYILCPHSMSGIEAILWAQKYPEDVEAIIGLDMSTPKAYTEEELADDGKGMIAFYTFLRKSGLGRLVLTDGNLSDHLDRHEKDIYRNLALTKFANKNAADEGTHLDDAINEINSADKPDIPTLLFVADGKETGGQKWIDAMNDYITGLTDARLIRLDCGHMVAEEAPEKIEEDMRTFISELGKK